MFRTKSNRFRKFIYSLHVVDVRPSHELEETAGALARLLLVSHPDDDAIFAGALQRRAAVHTSVIQGAQAPLSTNESGRTKRTPRNRLRRAAGVAPLRGRPKAVGGVSLQMLCSTLARW